MQHATAPVCEPAKDRRSFKLAEHSCCPYVCDKAATDRNFQNSADLRQVWLNVTRYETLRSIESTYPVLAKFFICCYCDHAGIRGKTPVEESSQAFTEDTPSATQLGTGGAATSETAQPKLGTTAGEHASVRSPGSPTGRSTAAAAGTDSTVQSGAGLGQAGQGTRRSQLHLPSLLRWALINV